ncbi:MAG: hypothetical protein AB2672_13840 [Candidatus Thiodiazotropha endolucinida]|nr:hypothetical protein [Candidatus Thiodiazotropha taylori]
MSKKQKKKAVVKKERQVNTYAEMWHCSRVMLYNGQEHKEGSYWQFMASLLFTAFTMEAYLNHIGSKLFKCWKDVENLSPPNKLKLICEMLKIDADYSKRPYQSIKLLFKFRNDVAHGKSVKIKSDKQIQYFDKDLDVIMKKPVSTSWERYSTEKNALMCREDIEKIIRELHDKAGIEDDPVFFHGMAFGSVSSIHE